MIRALCTVLALVSFLMTFRVPMATASASDFLTVSQARHCMERIASGLRQLGWEGGEQVQMGACGSLEQHLTPGNSITPMAGVQPCIRTSYRNLYGVITWWVQTCEVFYYNGNRITYYANPPEVTWWTSIGWEITGSSRGAEWMYEPWSARAWSSTNVKLTTLGWTIGTQTVNHQILIYGDGTYDASAS